MEALVSEEGGEEASWTPGCPAQLVTKVARRTDAEAERAKRWNVFMIALTPLVQDL